MERHGSLADEPDMAALGKHVMPIIPQLAGIQAAPGVISGPQVALHPLTFSMIMARKEFHDLPAAAAACTSQGAAGHRE